MVKLPGLPLSTAILVCPLGGGLILAIDEVKIFPPIGIARLGNSTDEFFIGPEIPGDHTPPIGGYKDSSFRIKRQAARFHLFGYKGGVLQQELTLADVDINWTVELANTKAEWKRFYQEGIGGGIEHPDLPRRNAGITDRDSLKITPGQRTLNGPNQTAAFDTGTFLGQPVPLGEMRIDADGHLLVLGGFGNSSSPTSSRITGFADNDGWQDDVSDGPVKATVRLKGENVSLQASSAWVICAPPKFAPPMKHIITLYDTLLQVAVDKNLLVLPTDSLSFTKDIYPLLARIINLRWVITPQPHLPSPGPLHAIIEEIVPVPGSTGPTGTPTQREKIFYRLRDPNTDRHTPTVAQQMPKIWSDVYRSDPTSDAVNAALTKTQYRVLKQWRDWIDIVNDWVGHPVSENLITPDGLTRAALESCVGGAFYPGIETSFMTRDTYSFIEPFRLDIAQLRPGDLTKQMAVPWQADFYDCTYEEPLHWWPAQRPEYVFLPDISPGTPPVPWTRDIIREPDHPEDMINNWHKLGFVVQQGDQYVETERHV
jgi:hypothetical protein